MAIPQSEVCLVCNEYLNHSLTVKHFYSFKPLSFPVVCTSCTDRFNVLKPSESDCKGCSRHLDEESNDVFLKPLIISGQTYCLDCARWLKNTPSELISHYALFDYNQTLQDWIVSYKYSGDVRMALVIAPYLKDIYKLYKEYQWVVLPSSPESLETRKFHPTGYLLDVAEIPYQVIHEYIGDGVKQAKKIKKERLDLTNTFKIKGSEVNLSKEKWLIFDDIYTTGATINHAKKMLYHFFKERDRIIQLISVSVARNQLNK